MAFGIERSALFLEGGLNSEVFDRDVPLCIYLLPTSVLVFLLQCVYHHLPFSVSLLPLFSPFLSQPSFVGTAQICTLFQIGRLNNKRQISYAKSAYLSVLSLLLERLLERERRFIRLGERARSLREGLAVLRGLTFLGLLLGERLPLLEGRRRFLEGERERDLLGIVSLIILRSVYSFVH